MLEITGRCMAGPDAVEFFERLADMIDEGVRTDDFCDDYTAAVNRLRYGVLRDLPCKVRVLKKGQEGRRFDGYSCGRCGAPLQVQYKWCPSCGQRLLFEPVGRKKVAP